MLKIEDLSSVNYTISPKSVTFDKNTRAKINEHWKNKLKDTPYLFNGQQFSCKSITKSSRQTLIEVNKTQYKDYIWMSDNKLLIPGVRPMGVGCVFYDQEEDSFTFLKRSNKVGRFKNMIGVVGGTLDYNQNIKTTAQMNSFVQNHLITEIKEEVVTKNPADINRAHFVGMYMNNYLVYRYIYTDKIIKTKNFESVGTVEVHTNELLDFVKDNEKIMLETTQSRYQDLIKYAQKLQK